MINTRLTKNTNFLSISLQIYQLLGLSLSMDSTSLHKNVPELVSTPKHKWLSCQCSIALAILISSCSHRHPPNTTFFAIDTSDRTESHLTRYATLLFTTQQRLKPQDIVFIYAFANDFEIVYSGHPIYSRSKFNETLFNYLTNRDNFAVVPNTRTDLLLESFATELAALRKGSTSLVIFTDGGLELKSESVIERITVAGEKLVATENVKNIVLAGLFPEHRRTWTDYLPKSPKVSVCGIADADYALQNLFNLREDN